MNIKLNNTIINTINFLEENNLNNCGYFSIWIFHNVCGIEKYKKEFIKIAKESFKEENYGKDFTIETSNGILDYQWNQDRESHSLVIR